MCDQPSGSSSKNMDITEAAEYLGIKRWTLYRLAKRGKVRCIRVKGQWLFAKDDLDNFKASLPKELP